MPRLGQHGCVTAMPLRLRSADGVFDLGRRFNTLSHRKQRSCDSTWQRSEV